jgi:hypothetical protein
MTIPDIAIVAALVFGWGTLSARLEHFDMTAPIIFMLARPSPTWSWSEPWRAARAAGW